MNRLIISFIMIIVCSVGYASSIKEQADSAYLADNYIEAEYLYNKVLTEEGSSSDLYYNLGNTYYRLGKVGKSILNYERALKLDPSNIDAQTNLEFVKTKIVDKQSDDRNIAEIFMENILNLFAPNTWAYIAISIFIIMIISIAVYIFSTIIIIRKIGFFVAIVLFVASIFSVIFAILSAQNATSNNEAIVIVESTILSTSPREPKTRTEEAVRLNEGSKVEIINEYENTLIGDSTTWYEVKINNIRAWIKADDVEKI